MDISDADCEDKNRRDNVNEIKHALLLLHGEAEHDCALRHTQRLAVEFQGCLRTLLERLLMPGSNAKRTPTIRPCVISRSDIH
jgi:hypothetical protein